MPLGDARHLCMPTIGRHVKNHYCELELVFIAASLQGEPQPEYAHGYNQAQTNGCSATFEPQDFQRLRHQPPPGQVIAYKNTGKFSFAAAEAYYVSDSWGAHAPRGNSGGLAYTCPCACAGRKSRWARAQPMHAHMQYSAQ